MAWAMIAGGYRWRLYEAGVMVIAANYRLFGTAARPTWVNVTAHLCGTWRQSAAAKRAAPRRRRAATSIASTTAPARMTDRRAQRWATTAKSWLTSR